MADKVPKTAGKYHAYAVKYPEYADEERGVPELLASLPPTGRGSKYVPADDGKTSTAGAGRGSVNPSSAKPQRSAQVEEAIQEVQDAKDRKKIADMGYKKGGSVSSASKRADGCAIRGKTKGRMV